MVNIYLKMFITIFFGMFGIHKFIDRKPFQGLLYFFTFGLFFLGWIIDIIILIQLIKKINYNKIKKTSRILGIIFSILLFVCCFEVIGDEDFSIVIFFICLVSGLSILKIFAVDDNIYYMNYTYRNYEKNKNLNESFKYVFNDEIIKSNPHNDLNSGLILDNKKLNETFKQIFRDESIQNNSYNNLNTSFDYENKKYNNSNFTNKTSYLTGKFYDENNIILEKYKSLKTPKYVLVEINDIINNNSNYYNSKAVIISKKLNDKFLDAADFFPYGMYWASISDFNEYQLKWYLYWRKEFLNKNILDTDYSYILAFARELACYTFNENASFNISALEYLYESYKDLFPDIKRYIPGWIDDMLSEVGYFYNQSDSEVTDVMPDSLLLSLTHDESKDKISITNWRIHYNEMKSDLSNKQLSLINNNQKYNNRFKKYAGLLAEYYINNGLSIEKKWFSEKIISQKKHLFDNINSPIERMQGTYKYKEYNVNDDFYYDMNQITKLCYDLVYPDYDMNEIDYVICQYYEGQYDLPEDFFCANFKKSTKNNLVKSNETEVKSNFSIDISKINEDSTKINFIDNSQSKLVFDNFDQDFINLFENKILDKKIAQQYCIKKGKMLNAYINNINEKYYSALQKELIIADEYYLRLNIEMEENKND